MRSNMQEVTNVFPGIEERKEARLQIVVGRLLCSDMRDMLESEVFCGRPIRWREGKGWFERTFTIAGPIEHVRQIKQRIDYWMGALGQMERM